MRRDGSRGEEDDGKLGHLNSGESTCLCCISWVDFIRCSLASVAWNKFSFAFVVKLTRIGDKKCACS